MFGFFRLTYTKNPREAAALGYVNAGTDRRIAGEIGSFLGRLQSSLSYKSLTLPTARVELLDGVLVETATDPDTGRAHLSIAIARGGERWATVRVGWRYDANWGDANSVTLTPNGFNPQPEIVGGYIFDVVIKLNASQTFISGHEYGFRG